LLPATLVIVGLIVPLLVSGNPDRAVAIGVRAVSATVAALTVADTLALDELPRALRTLRAPAGLVQTIHTMLTQLQVASRTAKRLALARTLRGAGRTAGTITLVPELLVRSAERAERVELARQLRGYDLEAIAAGSLRGRDAGLLSMASALAIAAHLPIAG
jgi:energy-coupling factor transporter transmembrane protein EcfT